MREILPILGVVMALQIMCGYCQQGNRVAFTKGQTSHTDLTQGETMLYNKDITMVNAHFDSTGDFVCSLPGLYTFNFFALTRSNTKVWLEIYRNGNYIASLYGYTAVDYADAGNTVMLYLNNGDRVYVKAHDNYNNALYGSANQIYTTFTGALLVPEDSDSSRVGFSVGLNHHMSSSSGQTVMYNTIFTNVTESDGYDPLSGRFVAPVDGHYVFHYHALAQSNKVTWLELYRNDMYVNAAYGYTGNAYADAGNTAILYLKSGDRVSVKTRDGKAVDIFGDPAQIYCTFSGALLSPTVNMELGQLIGKRGTETSGEEIAFSAGLTTYFDKSVGHKLVFDRIFSNLGTSFDVSTGIFTAKISGVYIFHYHALAQQDKVIWIELFHNYKYIDSLYGHIPTGYAAGGNSATLELVAGDEVYLDIASHNSWLFGAPDQIYCTFSGYLVKPTLDIHPVIG